MAKLREPKIPITITITPEEYKVVKNRAEVYRVFMRNR